MVLVRILCSMIVLMFLCGCSSRRPASQNDPSLLDASSDHEARPVVDGDIHGDGAAEGGHQEVATEQAIVDHVKKHEFGPALELLNRLPKLKRDTVRLRYLRGRLLEQLDRPSEAADALNIDASELPANVARDAQVRRATLLTRASRYKEARPLLRQLVVLKGSNRDLVRALSAKCTFELGEYEAAVKELRVLSIKGGADVDTFKIRLALAAALSKTGSKVEAKKVLRSLLVERPEHREVKVAEQALAAQGDEVSLTVTERIQRAKRLLNRRRFEGALTELAAVKRPSKRGQLSRWLHLKGMALYRKRHHYEEAAKLLAQSTKLGGPTAIDDEFHAARALSRADRDDEAIAAYSALVKAHPRHERAVEAEYLAAWLDLRHDRARGEVMMEKFLKGPRARRSENLRREATWHLAFRAFERRRYMQAAGLFDQYAKTGSKGLIRGRGLYWQARALESLGRKELAAKVYRAAVGVEPLHWYALLSRQRLAAIGGEKVDPFPAARPALKGAKTPTPLPPPMIPPDVSFYSSVGLVEDALDSMRNYERAIRASAPTRRGLEALLSAYSAIGGARRAYRLSWAERGELEKAPSPTNRWAWEAAYPRPYLSLVENSAEKHGVDPAHVYATMRQESGYAERVVSRADAIGLLQLLPSTARSIGRKHGVEVTREMLFEPRWNIELGVAEIASIHSATDGCTPLTIAAYNAGEKAVKRWLGETGEIELDRFVERIPYDETRNYVRRVTSHLARYRYLYGDSEPWPVELPERVGPRKTQ